jgi:uncharacterized membrane protein
MKVTSYFNSNEDHISSGDILLSIPAGKDKAVTANYIANKLRCLGQNSQPHIRKIISNLIDVGYLIGSCQNGYFIIKTAKEFKDYIGSLEVRKTGIQKRINHLYDNWANYNN